MFYSEAMTRAEYRETPCKSALNRVSGMPFRWSLNPYRGCVHGCHYCYARATHPYLGLNADEDFATKIVVKTNMPDVLRQELGRRAWPRERVAIGTATDAYQPCEGRYQLTRRCLEALRDFATPVSIVTKSTLILRDLDLLTELAQGPGATVYFTITTLDDARWRLIEPGTPPPLKRLEVLRRLTTEGVRCGVFLAPILPGITDSMASIEAVAAAAKAHGAASFGAAVLRLAPQVKEHYLAFVSETFPDLLPRYERAYAGTTISSDYQTALERRVARVRERRGFGQNTMQSRRVETASSMKTAAPDPAGPGQLTLPL
jgi:DNA repair photolyase